MLLLSNPSTSTPCWRKMLAQDIGALKALKNPPDVIKRIFDCVLLLR